VKYKDSILENGGENSEVGDSDIAGPA
jgi:hypothetical protein